MNIFILGSNSIGGAEMLTSFLNNHLNVNDYNSKILYLDNHKRTLISKLLNYLNIIFQCFKADSIVATTEGNSYFLTATLSVVFKKKSIIWVHSILSQYYLKKKYYLKFTLYCMKYVNIVVCCSSDVFDDLNKLGLNNIITIRNPLPPSEIKKYRNIRRKSSNKYIFRYFGRISEIKGIFKLIKQAPKILSKYDTQLILQGPNPEKIRIPINRSLRYKKETKGFEPCDNAVQKYAIHAPLTESFGLAVIEQAFHGEKVIWLSKHNTTTKFLEEMGFLYKNEASCPNFDWAVRRLLNSKYNKFKLVKLLNTYSFNVFCSKWEELLYEI